jgi:hypothetical protein
MVRYNTLYHEVLYITYLCFAFNEYIRRWKFCNIFHITFKPSKAKLVLKNSVHTSKETQHLTITKINWLMG